MSIILDRAIQIIDSNAQQLLPFLQLDKKSANLLLNDIINENDFIEKLSKILHLLMNQIKEQSNNSNNYFDKLVSDLYFLYPSIPRNPSNFSNWIKQKLTESSENELKYKAAEAYFQEELKKCKTSFHQLLKWLLYYQIHYNNLEQKIL